jgi:hypothetical protein
MTNKAQRQAFKRIYDRWSIHKSYRDFRKEDVHYYNSMGCWVVFLPNKMVLGVEEDGYTHS